MRNVTAFAYFTVGLHSLLHSFRVANDKTWTASKKWFYLSLHWKINSTAKPKTNIGESNKRIHPKTDIFCLVWIADSIANFDHTWPIFRVDASNNSNNNNNNIIEIRKKNKQVRYISLDSVEFHISNVCFFLLLLLHGIPFSSHHMANAYISRYTMMAAAVVVVIVAKLPTFPIP